ncbi:hypothetical protein AAE478_010227 [Parahypoxylon ruwenzoriense]
MSEESENEDRVASGLDGGPDRFGANDSDSGENDSDGSASESASASEDANGFLDMEAAESDGESDGQSELSNDTERTEQQHFFPQFRLLPPEIRENVWKFFDPYLTAKARVFHLKPMKIRVGYDLSPPITNKYNYDLWESATLAEQTAPARAMLATHRESRALALKSYPDILRIRQGRYPFRYNSGRDVILLTVDYILPGQLDKYIPLLGKTRYLAFDMSVTTVPGLVPTPPCGTGMLKAIFHCYDSSEMAGDQLQWCVSDSIRNLHVQTTEEIGGGVEDLEFMFCWPDLENHREYAQENIPRYDDQAGLETWPMVVFSFESGLRRYRKLQAAVLAEGEWKDKWSSEDESTSESGIDVDEYESDGIDDATIDDEEDSSEDEDDLVVQSDSAEDDASSFRGFSPLQDQNPEISRGDGEGVGNFSSLEPESPKHDDGDSERAVSDEEPTRKIGRNKRRIVSSEDEHESEEEHDEGTKKPSRPTKRARVVLSDTEDEDKGDDNGDVEHGHDSVNEVEDDESPGEDSDVSEDEESIEAKPSSLFAKLKQYLQENPVSPGSDANSNDDASAGSDDFGGGDDSKFPDDEDEDEMLDLDRDGENAVDMEEGYSQGTEDDEW